jgi:hypothetical protein
MEEGRSCKSTIEDGRVMNFKEKLWKKQKIEK